MLFRDRTLLMQRSLILTPNFHIFPDAVVTVLKDRFWFMQQFFLHSASL